MSVKQSSRFVSLMLILTLVFGTFCGTAAFAASSTTVTIYHTNDIHGKVNSPYAEDGTLTQICLLYTSFSTGPDIGGFLSSEWKC